jgi:hypothetical protein
MFKPDPSAGWIDGRHLASADAPVVVLVQDAHANPSAQFNAARIIEAALTASSSDLVLLEAGQGDLGLDRFRRMGTPGSRRASAADLVRKGRLQAAEYLQLTSDRNIRLHGAENRAAYERALAIYSGVLKLRPRALESVARMEQTLNALGPAAFGPALETFWGLRADHSRGSLGSAEYAERLLALLDRSGEKDLFYPNLKTLSKLRSKESRIRFRTVADHLARLGTDRSWEEMTGREIGRLLKEVPARTTPADRIEVQRFLEYRDELNRIDARAMLNEMGSAEDRLVAVLSGVDPEAGRWLTAAFNIEFLRRLVSLETDSASVERFLADGSDPAAEAAAILNRRILDLGRLEERAVFDDAALARAVGLARDFYRLAGRRDVFLAGRTVREMERQGVRSAVLVAGGYHASNLKKILEASGVSYISVVPRSDAPTDRARYEKLLMNSFSAIALYPAGARCAWSAETRRLLADAFDARTPEPVSAPAEASGPEGARLSADRVRTALLRVDLEVRAWLYRVALLRLDRVVPAMDAYHRAAGFTRSHTPEIDALFRREGPYLVGAPVNAVKKGEGVRVVPSLKDLGRLSVSDREAADPECALCPARRGAGQWSLMTRGEGRWVLTSNPFSLLPNRGRHIIFISQRHERQHASPISVLRMLSAARDLGPAYSVFQNARGAGSTLPEHHHVQAFDMKFPVLSDRFGRMEMRRVLGDAAGWSGRRSEMTIEAVRDYPGRPMVLRSKDPVLIAGWSERIIRMVRLLDRPLDFAARWDPRTGYELCLLPFQQGKVPASGQGLPASSRAEPRMVDYAQVWTERNGLLGGAGAPQAAGVMVTTHRKDGDVLRAPVAADAAAVERLIEGLLLRPDIFWKEAARIGAVPSDRVEDLLNSAPRPPAGARMSRSETRAELKRYLQTVRTYPRATTDVLKAAWDRMMDAFPADQTWTSDAAVTALYSQAVFETYRVLHEESVLAAAGGDAAEEAALRQAALAVSGRIARNRLPVRTRPEHYWILPERSGGGEWSEVRRYSDLDSGFQARVDAFFDGTFQLRRVHPIIHDQHQIINAVRNFLKRNLNDPKHPAAGAEGLSVNAARHEWEFISLVLESAPVHAGTANAEGQSLFERHSKRILNFLSQLVPNSPRGLIVITLLARQMILMKNAEYRQGESIETLRTFLDWERLKRVLELEADLYSAISAGEYVRRTALLASFGAQLKAPAEAAIGRIHGGWIRGMDQVRFMSPSAGQEPDAEFLYQAMISVMTGFWSHVRRDDDPEYLEIFLTHTRSRTALDWFMSFFKRNSPVPSSFPDHEVQSLVRSASDRIVCRTMRGPGGLTELLVIWPKDEPGLLSYITGVIAARGLGIRNIVGRTVGGRPTDHFWLSDWPAGPDDSLTMTRGLEADFEALRAGTITYPELFEREGRPYRAVRSRPVAEASVTKLPKKAKVLEWSLEARSVGYEPDLFLHLVYRWLYKNDVMIMGTADHRRGDMGSVSTGFSVVRQNGAPFAEHEIDDLVRRLNVFLAHPKVEAWTFYPELQYAAEKFSRAVPVPDAVAAWEELLSRVWAEPMNSNGALKMKEIDAKLRLLDWAEREAHVSGPGFGGLKGWIDHAAPFYRASGQAVDRDRARDSIRSFILNYPFLLWARGTPQDLSRLAAARTEAAALARTVIVNRPVAGRPGERAITAFLPTSEAMPELMAFMSRAAADLTEIRAFRAANDVFSGVVVQIQCRTQREADLSEAAIQNAARRTAAGADGTGEGHDPEERVKMPDRKYAPYARASVLSPRDGGFAFRVHVTLAPFPGLERLLLLFVRDVFPGLELARFESLRSASGQRILLGIRMKDDRPAADRQKDPSRDLAVEESELFLEALSAFLRIDELRPATDLPLFKRVTDARRRDMRKLHSEIISNYRRVAEAVTDRIVDGDHPAVAVDAQSGTGKTTLTRFVIQSLRRRGYEPFVAHGDLLFKPMAERKAWKNSVILAGRGSDPSERAEWTDEPVSVWRAQLIPGFIEAVMDAVEQPEGRRDVPIPGGFGYVRDPSELDYAYFTSRHNLDLLAGQTDRADVPGLVLPIRAGQIALIDGKYILRYLLPQPGKKARPILPLWLWKDVGKVERQFLERASRMNAPSGQDRREFIDGEVIFFRQAIQPSWILHERTVAPLIGGLRANLNSSDPWKWKLEPVPAGPASGPGARMAAPVQPHKFKWDRIAPADAAAPGRADELDLFRTVLEGILRMRSGSGGRPDPAAAQTAFDLLNRVSRRLSGVHLGDSVSFEDVLRRAGEGEGPPTAAEELAGSIGARLRTEPDVNGEAFYGPAVLDASIVFAAFDLLRQYQAAEARNAHRNGAAPADLERAAAHYQAERAILKAWGRLYPDGVFTETFDRTRAVNLRHLAALRRRQDRYADARALLDEAAAVLEPRIARRDASPQMLTEAGYVGLGYADTNTAEIRDVLGGADGHLLALNLARAAYDKVRSARRHFKRSYQSSRAQDRETAVKRTLGGSAAAEMAAAELAFAEHQGHLSNILGGSGSRVRIAWVHAVRALRYAVNSSRSNYHDESFEHSSSILNRSLTLLDTMTMELAADPEGLAENSAQIRELADGAILAAREAAVILDGPDAERTAMRLEALKQDVDLRLQVRAQLIGIFQKLLSTEPYTDAGPESGVDRLREEAEIFAPDELQGPVRTWAESRPDEFKEAVRSLAAEMARPEDRTVIWALIQEASVPAARRWSAALRRAQGSGADEPSLKEALERSIPLLKEMGIALPDRTVEEPLIVMRDDSAPAAEMNPIIETLAASQDAKVQELLRRIRVLEPWLAPSRYNWLAGLTQSISTHSSPAQALQTASRAVGDSEAGVKEHIQTRIIRPGLDLRARLAAIRDLWTDTAPQGYAWMGESLLRLEERLSVLETRALKNRDAADFLSSPLAEEAEEAVREAGRIASVFGPGSLRAERLGRFARAGLDITAFDPQEDIPAKFRTPIDPAVWKEAAKKRLDEAKVRFLDAAVMDDAAFEAAWTEIRASLDQVTAQMDRSKEDAETLYRLRSRSVAAEFLILKHLIREGHPYDETRPVPQDLDPVLAQMWDHVTVLKAANTAAFRESNSLGPDGVLLGAAAHLEAQRLSRGPIVDLAGTSDTIEMRRLSRETVEIRKIYEDYGNAMASLCRATGSANPYARAFDALVTAASDLEKFYLEPVPSDDFLMWQIRTQKRLDDIFGALSENYMQIAVGMKGSDGSAGFIGRQVTAQIEYLDSAVRKKIEELILDAGLAQVPPPKAIETIRENGGTFVVRIQRGLGPFGEPQKASWSVRHTPVAPAVPTLPGSFPPAGLDAPSPYSFTSKLAAEPSGMTEETDITSWVRKLEDQGMVPRDPYAAAWELYGSLNKEHPRLHYEILQTASFTLLMQMNSVINIHRPAYSSAAGLFWFLAITNFRSYFAYRWDVAESISPALGTFFKEEDDRDATRAHLQLRLTQAVLGAWKAASGREIVNLTPDEQVRAYETLVAYLRAWKIDEATWPDDPRAVDMTDILNRTIWNPIDVSEEGARLADRSNAAGPQAPAAVRTEDAAAFAGRLIHAQRGRSAGPRSSVRVWDPASPQAQSGVSRLVLEAAGTASWNGAPLDLTSVRTGPSRGPQAPAEMMQDFDLQRRSMDAVRIPTSAADGSASLAVHLSGFGRRDAVRDARLLLFARDLARESWSDPGFTVHLESDADGSFRSLLIREGFSGVLGTGPVPAAAAHLLTLQDLKALSARPGGLPATFRAVTVEDALPDLSKGPANPGRTGEEAVYAFRPLIRMARVLRGRDLTDLVEDYRRMTGRSIPAADLERLIAGDLAAAERWAFKPLRAILTQALSLYASAARMASRSA